jgi:hypothetical protein
MRCTLPVPLGVSPFYPRCHTLIYLCGDGYLRAKRRTRQAWDAEYGRIGREGNMWWLGSIRANWEQVFGPKTWTWLRTSYLSLFFISYIYNVPSPDRDGHGQGARVSAKSAL